MPADKLDITTFLLSSIHDMKNSLGMMAAYLEDALAEPGNAAAAVDTPARKKTAQALYEAQRVNNHLIQLLALYKIDQAFYPFDPQDRPLADLAREVLARAQPLADSKNITLDCECPEELYGWLDYELVSGVLVQAIYNALHYAKSHVLLSAVELEHGISLRVEDDGPGFPEFLLAQGNAVQRGISFDTGSTGLGLYFADVVAHLHKAGPDANPRTGSIRLENGGRLGGSCFSLDLP
jgi:signal transduction histidine kinase